MSKESIDQKYIDLVKALEAEYYTETPTLNKAQFDQQHGALWDAHEAELVAEGHIEPKPLPVDWVGDYAKAITDADKLDVLAKRAGLK